MVRGCTPKGSLGLDKKFQVFTAISVDQGLEAMVRETMIDSASKLVSAIAVNILVRGKFV